MVVNIRIFVPPLTCNRHAVAQQKSDLSIRVNAVHTVHGLVKQDSQQNGTKKQTM